MVAAQPEREIGPPLASRRATACQGTPTMPATTTIEVLRRAPVALAPS
jgi:hypothetical protein